MLVIGVSRGKKVAVGVGIHPVVSGFGVPL